MVPRRVYAVGDIHGRLDLLKILGAKIERDLERFPAKEPIVVFLGDYIDRGPESAGVVDWLVTDNFSLPRVTLRGNHEATLLSFMQNNTVLDSWRDYGGLETLYSYGVDVKEAMRGRYYMEARAKFLLALPSSHKAFFEETKLYCTLGDYFFCHAGVCPSVPLSAQREEDLLWARIDPSAASAWAFDKVIVHGHTPVEEPLMSANHINIDTGAYATGMLTCLVLDGEEKRFIST